MDVLNVAVFMYLCIYVCIYVRGAHIPLYPSKRRKRFTNNLHDFPVKYRLHTYVFAVAMRGSALRDRCCLRALAAAKLSGISSNRRPCKTPTLGSSIWGNTVFTIVLHYFSNGFKSAITWVIMESHLGIWWRISSRSSGKRVNRRVGLDFINGCGQSLIIFIGHHILARHMMLILIMCENWSNLCFTMCRMFTNGLRMTSSS